jgi:hypothetical protein
MDQILDIKNKLALLIGINKYPKLAPYYTLSGCLNDVDLISQILQNNFGFSVEGIALLKDEQATRNGILEAMDYLTKTAERNDIVVIYYSGHGSQMTDREGDEPSGLDDTIVPYDSGRFPNENRDISDDEIYAQILHLSEKTPYVTLIFDCCHSGTIARDAFGAKSRWLEPDLRQIDELPPSRVDMAIAKQSSQNPGQSGWLPLSQRYVLISGCQDEESAYEFGVNSGKDAIVHGAMTYFLGKELAKADSGFTYRDVFERVSSQVTAVHPRQHPQMEGTWDRELFNIGDIKPIQFVPVQHRINGEITLGAGAAHGMTLGSQWMIYPQTTKHVTEDMTSLGLVEITKAHSVTSTGKILEESSPGAIIEGGRAVEYTHSYGEMRMVVDIQDPIGYTENVLELKGFLKRSALLRIATDEEKVDARIYIIPPRTAAKKDDPIPQLGAVSEATWAVVGQDGKLMMPLHGISETIAAGELRNNLEKAVRYRQALALHNPSKDCALKSKVEFILKRRAIDGSWIEAKPEEQSGQIIFEEGERIAAEIINHYEAPIFVSVLDFGLTGAINLLYPIMGANERLVTEKSIRIGMREGEELELYFPEDFPYLPDPTDKKPIGGTEIFKLFATTQKADFSCLLQDGFRDISPERSEGTSTVLFNLLDLALTGHRTRDARQIKVHSDQEWTTVERSFILQRKERN